MTYDLSPVKKLWDQDGCLSNYAIESLADETLSEGFRTAVAEHLSVCDLCVDRYTHCLIEMPEIPQLSIPVEVSVSNSVYNTREYKRWHNFWRYVTIWGAGIAAFSMWLGFLPISLSF